MLSNQKFQFFIFFVLVAVVYAIANKDILTMHGDDYSNILFRTGYPLPSGGWIPHRLIDIFYGNVYNNFYYTFIYGLLYKPFFGELHYLDVQAQSSKFLWSIVFSGFCLLSILFTRLFVKLNIWHMAVYALLFYLFFVQYDFHGDYFNRIIADDLTFLMGLCFLYPCAHYVLTKKDPFAKWNEWTAVAFMLVLSYVAYFSIMWTIMLVSIGLLGLWLIHLLETYQRTDFNSFQNLWQKLKTEPKWFFASSLLAPLMVLAVLGIALGSDRAELSSAKIERLNIPISEQIDSALALYSNIKLGYDDKQIAFFVIIFLCLVGVWVYRKRLGEQVILSSIALKRVGFLLAGILLFSFFVSLLGFMIAKDFSYAWQPIVRFILVTASLGLGFHFLHKDATKPLIALLFFIFSFGAVRAISALVDRPYRHIQKKYAENDYYIHNHVKMAINLGYTFSCYNESKAPFYNKTLATQHNRLIPNGVPKVSKRGVVKQPKHHQWNKIMLFLTKARSQWQFGKLKQNEPAPEVVFYYEPSIKKINAKLAELQRTKTWRCVRVKDDIYRVEKLDY